MKLLRLAFIAMLAPCVMAADPAERHIRFTAVEFTKPTIDISKDGSEFYFNVLGEIYRAPIAGGTATLFPLGEGWKERPMLSPDGKSIAFLSDRGGEVAVWRQLLAAGNTPIGKVQKDKDVTTAAWVSGDIVVASGIETARSRPWSLGAIDFGGGQSELPASNVQEQSQRSVSMSADLAGNIYLMRAGTGVLRISKPSGLETVVVESRDELAQPRVTRDGSLLGFVALEKGQTMLFTKQLHSGVVKSTGCLMEPLHLEYDGAGPEASYAFMSDNRSVLLARAGGIYRCDFGGATRKLPISVAIDLKAAPRAQPRRLTDLPMSEPPQYLASTPDQSLLAFTSQGHIWLANTTSHVVRRLSVGTSREYMPAFSPTGKQLAYISIREDGWSQIVVRDLRAGTEMVVASSPKLLLNPAWSPDGTRLALLESAHGARDGGPLVMRWVNMHGKGDRFGEIQVGDNIHHFPVVTWNSDGTGVFYTRPGSFNTEIELVSHLVGSEPRVLLRANAASAWDMRISPDAKYIAFQDRLGILIAPMAATTAEQSRLERDDIERMTRITGDGADYFQWTEGDRLVWNTQADVYTAELGERPAKLASLSVPKAPDRKIGRVAYVGARVITMADKGVIDDAVLITDNDKIAYVGSRPDAGPLNGLSIVDISGKTVIPGLIDVHSHHFRPFEVEETAAFTQAMFATVAYGVTTVFNPSGPTIEQGINSAVSQDDDFMGPSYYGAGLPILGAFGTYNQPRIRSREEASRLVNLMARSGMLMVKEYLQTTRRQRRWLADAARESGVGITAHEDDKLRIKLSLVADGYTGIEHEVTMGPLRDDAKKLLIASGIAMTTTLTSSLSASEYLRSFFATDGQRNSCLMEPGKVGAEPVEFEVWTDQLKANPRFAFVRDYVDMLNKGGNVSIGGHGEAHGIDTHWEMWLLGLGGATPINILRAATVNGARKLGMEESIGSLAAGMDADFVVLNSNPLEDIRNSVDISRVVRRGRTISWPSIGAPPAWQSSASWQQCRDWNLGLAH